MDTLDDTAPFDRYHLGEELLDALGCAPSQVALAALGAHHHARPGDLKALGCGLVGLELVLGSCLLARHFDYSFSHKTPVGEKAPNLDRFGALTHGINP